MFEVEQKYRVEHLSDLHRRLEELGATAEPEQQHRDAYFNHPSRDFAETGEAFRVRRIDGTPLITYKGAKYAGAIKARRELEWRLDPGDPEGNQTEELLGLLGFQPVATVQKRRCPYRLGGRETELLVVIDDVDSIGVFAELERVVEDESQIESARVEIHELSAKLGLRTPEPRSYLEMVLEFHSGDL